jgi:hypothetical protein
VAEPASRDQIDGDETMDKQLFDDAIGEVPPSTVDVDAAIARGRRAEWGGGRRARPWRWPPPSCW